MDRFEKIATAAALVLALLPACNGPKKQAAPASAAINAAAKPDMAPEASPASPLVARLEAYGALMFPTEDGKVRTSACLSLDEIPPQAGFDGAEPAFHALMKACKAKDQKAYEAIAVAEQLGKRTNCSLSMNELFSQFGTVTFKRIDHVYEFDNLVLVDAVLRMGERDVTFAFTFERRPDGKLQYAPCPERTPFYDAVRSWLSDPRAGDEFNPRCPADVVERATHRVPFGPDPARAGALLLRGAPMDEPGDLRAIADRVTAAIQAIERAVAAKDMRGLQEHMAKKGAEVAEWWRTASEQDRAAHAKTLTGLEPFFVFDASPLVIAYVRKNGGNQVMYFVPAADGRLIWTNSALITGADDLFKRGPLRESASLPGPFSDYRID